METPCNATVLFCIFCKDSYCLEESEFEEHMKIVHNIGARLDILFSVCFLSKSMKLNFVSTVQNTFKQYPRKKNLKCIFCQTQCQRTKVHFSLKELSEFKRHLEDTHYIFYEFNIIIAIQLLVNLNMEETWFLKDIGMKTLKQPSEINNLMQICDKTSPNLQEVLPLLILQEDFVECSTNKETVKDFEALDIFKKIHDEIEELQPNLIETTESGSLVETVLQSKTDKKNDPLETNARLETFKEYKVILQKTSSSESDCQKIDILEIEQKYSKLITFDPEKQLWQCQRCSFGGKVELNMKAHVEKHMQGVFFRCLYCNTNKSHKRNLLLHMKKHNNNLYFPCPFCQREFNNKGTFKKHILKFHAEQDPELTITTFKSLNIVKHICKQCTKAFRQMGNLRRHTAYIHNEEKPYMCSKCQKSFKRSDDIKRHDRTHTSEKPWHCKQCLNTFKSLCDLKRHTRKHLRGKPYICETCNKAFATSKGLLKHGPTHISKICQHCMKVVDKQNFLRHLKIHSTDKLLDCRKCSKSFKRGDDLKRHEKSHGEETSLMCVQCQKICQTLSALKNHKRSHIIKSCTVCEKKFKNYSSFKKHFISHESKSNTVPKKYKADVCNPHCN